MHGLKRYNDRWMTPGQMTCSLGGTGTLGLLLAEKRLFLRWIVDIVKGIRSSLEEFCESSCYFLSQQLLLFHVMKMCHNSDATYLSPLDVW